MHNDSGAWFSVEKVKVQCEDLVDELEDGYSKTLQVAEKLLKLCNHTCDNKIWITADDAFLIFDN